MQRSPLLRFSAAWGLLLLSTGLLTAAEFLPLGFNARGGIHVSADGSVVVGNSLISGGVPATTHRWTRETGAEVVQECNLRSQISGDGSTIFCFQTESEEVLLPVRITARGSRSCLCQAAT